MTTILLTGATGYIASHTWIALKEAGFRVLGVDNFANSSPVVLQRLEAQQAKVEARLAKTGARPAVRVPKAPGVPATKTNPKAAQRSRRTTGDAPASGVGSYS